MALKINKEAFEKRAKDLGYQQPYAVSVAEQAKVGAATVYRALRGEEFNSGTVEKIASALRCNPFDILETPGSPDPLLGAQALSSVFAQVIR